MTHDIPYPFRQNTDFLYLCGFLEPNSVLILEAKSGKLPDHTAMLFVPKKDPHKELWDGPRSGIEGTLRLTGVDNAENIDDLEQYLDKYSKSNKGFVLWYNCMKPVHPEFHSKYFMEFMKLNRHGFTENPRGLMQTLRLFKSDSEIKLMQKTCDIASAALMETMKYSHVGVSIHLTFEQI
jgi:Xaa-Pro aminopeptidase